MSPECGVHEGCLTAAASNSISSAPDRSRAKLKWDQFGPSVLPFYIIT